MTENAPSPDREKEKKTNQKLAIGVGVLGMGMFGSFYVLFFVVMLFKPGLFFSILPTPSITTTALSDGNRTYLLSQKLDMSTISVKEKREPRVMHFISILQETALASPREIPAYAFASGGDNRLVFLSDGLYRSYDGMKWIDVKTEGIGKDPRGTATPDGLFVMSLSLIHI